MFLAFLVYSKHLYTLAPVVALFSRRPDASERARADAQQRHGAGLRGGHSDSTDVFGLGKIEGLHLEGPAGHGHLHRVRVVPVAVPGLGHRQVPLSPKQVILDLRDHGFKQAPYLLVSSSDTEREKLPDAVKAEAGRPLVGPADHPARSDPDVLWSCTNCGACVEEQLRWTSSTLTTSTGMRRHQVLIESAFPVEAGWRLRNLENKGDPWWGWAAPGGPTGSVNWTSRCPWSDGKIETRMWSTCSGWAARARLIPGPQDDQGDRPAAAHRQGEVRRARPGRDLHRRPGLADRQRVRAPRCWPPRTSRR